MKQQFSKKILRVLSLVYVFTFVLLAETAHSATTGANPTGTSGSNAGTSGSNAAGGDFGSTLEQLFEWGVGITSVLAVVMLVIGGVQYMGSESLFAKDDGKKRMQAALGGLLIALASILILTTILGGEGGPFNVNLQL